MRRAFGALRRPRGADATGWLPSLALQARIRGRCAERGEQETGERGSDLPSLALRARIQSASSDQGDSNLVSTDCGADDCMVGTLLAAFRGDTPRLCSWSLDPLILDPGLQS